MRARLALVAVAGLLTPAAASTAPMQGGPCAAAIAYSDAHDGNAVLILKDGKPVCAGNAAGTGADDPHPLFSGTKGFAAAMAIIAADDGLLDLDEPVSRTIGEWRDGTAREAVTVRQLLSLSSGIAGVVGRPPTYAEAVALVPQAAPGSRFLYGPAPFQLFGELLRRKLAARRPGDDPASWLARRLFEPIGLRVGEWRRGPDGNPLLPQGLSLAAADWARFGEWVRRDGTVDGRRLVAPDRLDAFHRPSGAFAGYGLGWWLPARLADPAVQAQLPQVAGRLDFATPDKLPDDLLMAAGAGDQRLYVSKTWGVTVVRFARFPRGMAGDGRSADAGWSDAAFLNLVAKIVQPAER